jgi:hypothetical protein
MMRIIFILMLISGCVILKYVDSDFKHRTFICDNGPMVGKSFLIFYDNEVYISERDSLFIGYGTWNLNPDKKVIYISGIASDKHINTVKPITKTINYNLKVKSKSKLQYNGQVYTRYN